MKTVKTTDLGDKTAMAVDGTLHDDGKEREGKEGFET